MTIMAKPRFTAACAALIAAVALVSPATAQQPPAPGSRSLQVTPAQPGPGMGQQMMLQGKEHGQAGQSMGAEMMQRGMERGWMGMGQGMAGHLTRWCPTGVPWAIDRCAHERSLISSTSAVVLATTLGFGNQRR